MRYNPNLCHIDNINWKDLITTKEDFDNTFLIENKNKSQCNKRLKKIKIFEIKILSYLRRGMQQYLLYKFKKMSLLGSGYLPTL